jgi:hypothetical protein
MYNGASDSACVLLSEEGRMTAQEAFDVELAWRDLVIAGQRERIDCLLDKIERLLPRNGSEALRPNRWHRRLRSSAVGHLHQLNAIAVNLRTMRFGFGSHA